MTKVGRQLDLFHVHEAYAQSDRALSNDELYEEVAKRASIPMEVLNEQSRVGKAGALCSKLKRKIRWYQQTLKQMKLIHKVDGSRGLWEFAMRTPKGLHEIRGSLKLVAYSTDLGLALWANNHALFSELNEPIHLCVTSPPYPLRTPRSYGNVTTGKWVDFMTVALEPIVKNLVRGGAVVLNVCNDIFETGKPSRSLYLERMILALNDRLGLHLMDRWIWVNPSKPPGPTQWASITRQQLCSGWEPVLWFSNDPSHSRGNNRRVLLPHTAAHERLMEQGGERRDAVYGDGAYRLREGSFSHKTEGRIPKNYFVRSHVCKDSLQFRKNAETLGLPPHPAMFPTDIPDFAVQFLTEEGDLVVDPFAGSNKTGLAAQRRRRRWLACDVVLEYVRAQAELFSGFEGFWTNPALGISEK